MQQCLHGLKVGKPTSAKSHPSLILGHLEPLSVIDHLEMCLNVACGVDSPPSNEVPSSSFGDVKICLSELTSWPRFCVGSRFPTASVDLKRTKLIQVLQVLMRFNLLWRPGWFCML